MHCFETSLTPEKLQGHSETEEGVSIGRLEDRKEADLQTPTHTETTASAESSTRGLILAPSSIHRNC
jgi:hypothetical protein